MREIKFRAWDKLIGEMTEVVTLDLQTKNANDDDYYGMSPLINGEYVLMQYTGLEDKNGREIYEGDIVKYKDCGKEHVSEIIQDFSLGTGHYVRCPGLGFYTINESTIVMLEIEVIGNIYENPELLECEE